LHFKFVMPGLVPGIHVFGACKKDVDGRDKPGHDKSRHLASGPSHGYRGRHCEERQMPRSSRGHDDAVNDWSAACAAQSPSTKPAERRFVSRSRRSRLTSAIAADKFSLYRGRHFAENELQ
jgi:hypothetical protein